MSASRFLFAIFAHPDDEAFGPSGTLILRARAGWKVHIICLTDGAAGGDAATRSKELRRSCELIGATVHQFDFSDGHLNNNNYHAVADKIKSEILEAVGNGEAEVDFMTFEPQGLSGHIDHIVASLVATFVYSHWQDWAPKQARRGELRYFCLCDKQKSEDLDYFVYSPAGYSENDIDETVLVGDILEQKKDVIRSHASQRDHERALNRDNHSLANEHFLLYRH